MKKCGNCVPDGRDPEAHVYDPRPPEEWSCNWLDWMVEEEGGVCPHCGGPVMDILTVTPLGRELDALTGPDRREEVGAILHRTLGPPTGSN